jgi:hypothetical protein
MRGMLVFGLVGICLMLALGGCGPTAEAPAVSQLSDSAPAPAAAATAPAPQQPADEPQAATEQPVPSADTVYVTNTGNRYHRAGCASLSRSQIAMSRDQAVANGYTPCGRCNP